MRILLKTYYPVNLESSAYLTQNILVDCNYVRIIVCNNAINTLTPVYLFKHMNCIFNVSVGYIKLETVPHDTHIWYWVKYMSIESLAESSSLSKLQMHGAYMDCVYCPQFLWHHVKRDTSFRNIFYSQGRPFIYFL